MSCKFVILLAVLLFQYIAVTAQTNRFYIANDDHTDYVWTANEAVYKNVMLTTLDKYLLQIDSSYTAGLPFKHQSKYNCDGSFWFWLYERNRTEAQMNNLITKVKSGHMTVPYNPLAVLYGGLPAEASIRGMYYSGYLQKRYGIEMRLAISMESQVLPLGLSSLWRGSGVKYSWKGVCGCASKMDKPNIQNRDHEVYYYKGLDGQKVLMKWYSLSTKSSPCGGDVNESLGGYAEARCLNKDLIERMRQKSITTKHNVVGAFGYGWDDLQTYTNKFISLAKSSSNSTDEIIVSNETDYFTDMEATYGNALSEESVAGGNEWDLYIASMAEVSARVKRSTEKLRAAEAMATVVSLNYPDFAKDLTAMRDSAWMSVGLYPEHDWTANGPVPREERAGFQRRMENNYSRYADTLYNLSVALLGNQIKKTGSNDNKCFFVFNPLNWVRNDFADIPYDGNLEIAVYDVATKKEVLWQSMKKEGRNYLRILATDIPSVGYKVFEILKKSGTKQNNAATLAGNIFENGQYKITLTKEGVMTGLIDKVNGNKELVTVSPDGRYINDMGSGTSNIGDGLVIEHEGPVSVTLKARTDNKLKHTTSITLFNSLIPRIDIVNNIEQNFSALISNTFSLNFIKPEVWHEEIGAIIKAKLTTEGGHYAARNARYDWLTLNHFACLGTQNYHISIANRDCFFFKVGASTPGKLDADASYINVLVGGQTDDEQLGIKNQGGDSSFTQQFSISVNNNGLDKTRSMKSALEFQQPLITNMISGDIDAVLPADKYSFLQIANPNMILWALKPAEEGIKNNGLIARVWNLNDASVKSELRFNKKLSSANETTHVEVNMNRVSFNQNKLMINTQGQQMKTFRVKLK